MAKKKKSKLKKFLKGAALAGAAALGASALGRRKQNQTYLAEEGGARSILPNIKRLMTSDRAYTGGGYDDPIMTGGVGVKFNRRNMYSPNDFGLGPYDGAKKGGRAGKDFGKRGVGKAKRGFGRAMKKGGK